MGLLAAPRTRTLRATTLHVNLDYTIRVEVIQLPIAWIVLPDSLVALMVQLPAPHVKRGNTHQLQPPRVVLTVLSVDTVLLHPLAA